MRYVTIDLGSKTQLYVLRNFAKSYSCQWQEIQDDDFRDRLRGIRKTQRNIQIFLSSTKKTFMNCFIMRIWSKKNWSKNKGKNHIKK